VSMRQKLEYLQATGRLSAGESRDALEVWQRGNEVLHNNIDNVQHAPEIVFKTLRVIGALFPQTAT
jgi:hypothetical protein